jgi:hypothetical protein
LEVRVTDVTNELVYECLKRMQADISTLKEGQKEIKAEIGAMGGTVVSMQQDIHNIYGVLARHDERLDRIERRLDLQELAERGQSPFDPHN